MKWVVFTVDKEGSVIEWGEYGTRRDAEEAYPNAAFVQDMTFLDHAGGPYLRYVE